MNAPTNDHRRILIVDDNPDIHRDYRKILIPEAPAGALDDLEAELFGIQADPDQREIYEVDSAYQGAEAHEKVMRAQREGRPYAVAFVDMRMPPGWDGLETIEHLWEVDPELQIIIATAYSDHSREEIVARTGGAHRLVILRKPFDTAEVAQLAYAMTAKWLASRQATMKMSELEALVEQRTQEISATNGELQRRLAELEQTKAALERSEQRFSLAAAGSNDGLWDWEVTTGRVYYSPRWNEIVGLPEAPAEATLDAWLGRVHPNEIAEVARRLDEHIEGRSEHFESEHRLRRDDGSYLWVLCRGVAVRDQDGLAVRMAGSLSDVSRRKETEHELRHGAYFDKLTGLPNRALLRECLEEAIEARTGEASAFTVLFLDFDNFKVVNDSLGHCAGDELLTAVASRISRCIQTSAAGFQPTVARLGGDEFVVLLRGQCDPAEIAMSIQAALREPLALHGTEVHTSASIGITIDTGTYSNPDDVLRDADTAMYYAKEQGAGQYAVFDEAMRNGAVARLALENDLRLAIQDGSLGVHYQPIIDLASGKTIGAEALVRWTHPKHGFVSPDRFIPIAEETGLIVPLGHHVLRTACNDIRRMRDLGLNMRVNVNLSSRQFSQASLVESVTQTLESFGLPTSSLCLEVTETVVMDDVDAAAATIRRLRDIGIQVYMDDFGTGYSSLSCLKLLPLTGLKLDRSFTAHLEDGSANPAIIHAVVTLAGHLQLSVVAEGVENTDQLAAVLALECDSAQGYHFGKPMPIDEFIELAGDPVPRARAA